MRIHAVTPIHVDEAEVARRQARYDALAPRGVRVELHDIGPEAPRALETEADVRASEELVGKALAAARPGVDATLPDCVLDPAVPAPGGEQPFPPTLGLLRLGVGAAVLAGARVAAVARNRAIAAELEARIAAYGWSGAFLGVTVLDLAVEDIEDGDRWVRAVRPALERAGAAGADVVLNGCSAVDVEEGLDPALPRLLDPISTALRLLR
ncbi:hypothetical protein GCM10010472_17520 [Pseudonocardia halophobica]|uniref:Asp/Glu/hydantoin racemase n=1 Tax=Pseudonocardia halophobica TaxID=29401 RepID=A0A9W6NUX9_9PSEU|nr:aspartate/glutamate racemase family protein [Pseudonocardia halophobica]GLL10033.1 hypothetical protein GCM10017577_11730 [Pseudonocardia halophobica]